MCVHNKALARIRKQMYRGKLLSAVRGSIVLHPSFIEQSYLFARVSLPHRLLTIRRLSTDTVTITVAALLDQRPCITYAAHRGAHTYYHMYTSGKWRPPSRRRTISRSSLWIAREPEAIVTRRGELWRHRPTSTTMAMSNLYSKISTKPMKRFQDNVTVKQTNAWMNGECARVTQWWKREGETEEKREGLLSFDVCEKLLNLSLP